MNSLIDYEPTDIPSNMEIRTEKITPINSSANTNTFKFEILNVGYLDSNSMLTFKAVDNTGGNGLRANCFNGGLGAIKRVQFKIGDFMVCDFQELSRLSTMLNMNIPPSTRNNFQGHFIGNNFHVKVGEVASTANNGPNAGGTGSFHLSADSGLDQGNLTGGGYAGVAIKSRPILSAAASDKFGIPLGYLIPALANGRKIPLFLFKDYRLHIEVEFNGAKSWVNDISRTANNLIPANNTDITYSDVELLIDYILPPAAVMNADEAQSAKEGGYRFEFGNHVLIKKALPAVSNARELQDVEHRLGLNGREVHKIYQMKQYADEDSSRFILLDQKIDGVNDEEYNMEINGVKLYPDFKFNNADQYNQTNYSLGLPLYVPRCMAYSDDNTIFSELASFESGLQGNFKPLSVDLANGNNSVVGGGTLINNHPIVFQYRRRPCSNAATNPDYKRAMNVSYYATLSRFVNVVSTPNGTNVNVSY